MSIHEGSILSLHGLSFNIGFIQGPILMIYCWEPGFQPIATYLWEGWNQFPVLHLSHCTPICFVAFIHSYFLNHARSQNVPYFFSKKSILEILHHFHSLPHFLLQFLHGRNTGARCLPGPVVCQAGANSPGSAPNTGRLMTPTSARPISGGLENDKVFGIFH